MLDPEGFVSETNATNVFMVKHGVVYTPHADYCLPGLYLLFFPNASNKVLNIARSTCSNPRTQVSHARL